MQAGQVEWDPQYINVEPGIALKVFALYLLVILMIVVLSWGRLWLALGFSSRGVLKLLKQIGDAFQQGNSSAVEALANRLPTRGPECALQRAVVSSTAQGLQLTGIRLRVTEFESRFAFWRLNRMTRAIKWLATFTVLLTFLIVGMGGTKSSETIWMQKSIGWRAVAGVVMELFLVFSLGMAISALLFASYAYFQARLDRRRAHWELLCIRIDEKSSVSLSDRTIRGV